MGGERTFRMTPQRRVILEELRRSEAHPSADELYERVRRRLPRISLATVYRNLDLLAERGMIRRIEAGGGRRRFDGRTEPHHHVRCTRCGRVEDLPAECLEGYRTEPAERLGFAVSGCRFELLGLCPDCR